MKLKYHARGYIYMYAYLVISDKFELNEPLLFIDVQPCTGRL